MKKSNAVLAAEVETRIERKRADAAELMVRAFLDPKGSRLTRVAIKGCPIEVRFAYPDRASGGVIAVTDRSADPKSTSVSYLDEWTDAAMRLTADVYTGELAGLRGLVEVVDVTVRAMRRDPDLSIAGPVAEARQ